MYESFFGFKAKPFSLLPDPSLFHASQIHQEALTLLEYGLYNQAGFTVVTGEIGSGKTTLMRYLLERLERDMTVGLITHTHQSFGRITDWICAAFDIQAPRDDRLAQHQVLVDFLLAEHARGRKTLLIIDEAQNLDRDALEEIRLLSNINAAHDVLLQLLLLGQPELRELLRQPGLEQFIQRVSASYHLGRLSLDDCCRYMRHRLGSVGGRPDIFTPEACHAIFHYSRGIPRLINLICDTALVFAYGAGEHQIDGRAIDAFVQSDSSRLLFAIDGEHIQPLPEYRPILAEELEEERRAWTETLQSETVIAPRLHTPTPPSDPNNTLSSVDDLGWSATAGTSGSDHATAAWGRRRSSRTILAILTGIMGGIGLVGWYSQGFESGSRSDPTESRPLAWQAPESAPSLPSDAPEPDDALQVSPTSTLQPDQPAVSSESSAEPTLETASPFEALIQIAQEPSGLAALTQPTEADHPPFETAESVITTEPGLDVLDTTTTATVADAEPDSATDAERDLTGLTSRLTERSIQVERLAPNHLRADFSHVIRFRDGSVALDEGAREVLADLAALLKDNERIAIHVVTHTDTEGATANNQRLSERRAADIALILRLQGLPGSRITHEGKGSSEPKFTPEEERRLGGWVNRRVEIDLIATD